ncbi:lycopene cyclase family protein [Rhodococcus rhodochrous]|uniref:lycopene cyclase family protein n=1 Tax=Rhodococcus rhodochrous TaxID=1829 RepID=UPI002B26CBAE|nr:lycopene cyclase family protein [Rhodococcus rhodochrous]
MTHLPPTDLVVAGLGPAGRALAFRAAAAGLSVTAVDVRPQRRWTATYAAWADELPAWLPDEVVAAHIDSPAAWTTGPHTVDRAYRVLDTTRLQEFLALDEVTVVTGRVRDVDADGVVLGDGRRMPARYVVDARGVPADPGHAQQTAFGLIVDDAIASPALDGHAAWFMDWRRDNGTGPDDVPSFLYAVPAGDGRTIVEETCLVGRPALGLGELERRLHVRLEARGVRTTGDEVVERVRFAVEGAPTAPGVVGFGARGGLMHPATGYAVATALSTADAWSMRCVAARIRTASCGLSAPAPWRPSGRWDCGSCCDSTHAERSSSSTRSSLCRSSSNAPTCPVATMRPAWRPRCGGCSGCCRWTHA